MTTNAENLKRLHKEDALIGTWLYTGEDADFHGHQGQIIARAAGDLLLIEFYSWLDGYPTGRKLIPTTKVAGWDLYGDVDEMNGAVQKLNAEKRRAIEREAA
jgi:hypothetical protein